MLQTKSQTSYLLKIFAYAFFLCIIACVAR